MSVVTKVHARQVCVLLLVLCLSARRGTIYVTQCSTDFHLPSCRSSTLEISPSSSSGVSRVMPATFCCMWPIGNL